MSYAIICIIDDARKAQYMLFNSIPTLVHCVKTLKHDISKCMILLQDGVYCVIIVYYVLLNLFWFAVLQHVSELIGFVRSTD